MQAAHAAMQVCECMHARGIWILSSLQLIISSSFSLSNQIEMTFYFSSRTTISLGTIVNQTGSARARLDFFWKKYRWIGLLVGLRFRASVVYKDGVDLKVGPAGDKVCLCYV